MVVTQEPIHEPCTSGVIRRAVWNTLTTDDTPVYECRSDRIASNASASSSRACSDSEVYTSSRKKKRRRKPLRREPLDLPVPRRIKVIVMQGVRPWPFRPICAKYFADWQPAVRLLFEQILGVSQKKAKLIDSAIHEIHLHAKKIPQALVAENVLNNVSLIIGVDRLGHMPFVDFQMLLGEIVSLSMDELHIPRHIVEQAGKIVQMATCRVPREYVSRKALDRAQREEAYRQAAAKAARLEAVKNATPANKRKLKKERSAARDRKYDVELQGGNIFGLGKKSAPAPSPSSETSSTDKPGFGEGMAALSKLAVAGVDLITDPVRTATMKDMLARIKVASDSVAGGVNAFQDVLDQAKNMLTGVYDGFMKYGTPALAVAGLVTLLFWIWSEKSPPPFIWIMLTTFAAQLIGEKIWNLVSEFFRQDTEIRQEGGGLASLSKLIATAFVGHALGARWSIKSAIECCMARIGYFDKISMGLESMFEFCLKACQTCIDVLAKWMNVKPYRLLNDHRDVIVKMMDDLTKLEHDATFEPNKNAEGNLQRYADLHRGFAQYRSMFHNNHSITRGLDDGMRRLLRLAAPLRAAAGQGTGFRPQPVSICLAGKPGVGKTMVVINFLMTVFKMAGLLPENATEEDACKQIFNKPWNSEYMDGYTGQLAYVLDDFMMKRATPTDTSNGFLDLMSFYGNFTVMLNMAHLESKGLYPFTSKLLLMTTNMTHINQGGADGFLLAPEALERRVDLNFEMRVRPEFQLGEARHGHEAHELDFAKFEKECEKCTSADTVSGFPWHIWEVFPTTWNGGRVDPPAGSGQSMHSLILETVELLRRRADSHADVLKSVKRIVEAPVTTIDQLRQLVREQSGQAIEQQGGSITWNGEIQPATHGDAHGTNIPSVTLEKMGCREVGVHSPSWWRANLPRGRPEPTRSPSNPCPIHDRVRHYVKWVNECGEHGNVSVYDKLVQDDAFECNCKLKGKACAVDISKMDHKERLRQAGIKERDSMIESFRKVGEKMSSISVMKLASWASTGAIVLSGIVLVARLVKVGWNYLLEYFCGQKVEQQSNRPRTTGVKFKVQQQSGSLKGLHQLVYASSYKLAVPCVDGNVLILGQLTFLKGDYFVMPLHFRKQLLDAVNRCEVMVGSKLVLRNCKAAEQDLGVGMTVEDFLAFPHHEYKDRDLDFVRMTSACRVHRDTTKFLLTEADLKCLGGHAVRLDTARIEQKDVLVDFNERVTYMTPSVEVGKGVKFIGEARHSNWIRYSGDTEKGDCGASVCLQTNTHFSCRVWCGLHVGAEPRIKKCYGTILTQELVSEALSHLAKLTKDPCKQDLTLEETIVQGGLYVPQGLTIEEDTCFPFYDPGTDEDQACTFGSFDLIGKTSIPVVAPVKSKLEPTMLMDEKAFVAELGECEQVPMKLAPYKENGTTIYPMVEALRPFASEVRYVASHKFAPAVRVAMKPFGESTSNVQGRVLSFEEAVVGNPGMSLKGIPRGTSTGYPMCVEASDKSYYFGKGDDLDLTTPEAVRLKSEVLALEKLVLEGKRPFFICRGFLKDETRKRGKKARYIAGTAIHYYILCRMYFGSIVCAQMNNFTSSGMCPGINPFGDWDWLHEHIQRNGPKVWDGDFTGFDTSQQPSMLFELLHYINEWYDVRGGTAADSAARHILFLDLAFSKHIVGRGNKATHIVQWQKSLPSGHFLTGFINSMLSMSCIVAAFMWTTGRCDFWECASVATLGDDNVVNASESVIEEFNQVSTAHFLRDTFGMVYTAGRKGEELKPYLGIDDIVFLQRRFAVKNNKVVCPIRFESFLTNMYYTRKGSPAYVRQVLVDLLETALSELSMHPEDAWDHYAPQIVEFMRRIDHQPMLPWKESTSYLNTTLQRTDPGWW